MSTLSQQYNDLPEDASRVLYVNLPPTAGLSPDIIYQFFGQFGPLQDLRIKQGDLDSGASPQHIFVVYQDILDAQNAMAQLNSSSSNVGFIKARYFQVTKSIPQWTPVSATLVPISGV